jgi:hypothetical protein
MTNCKHIEGVEEDAPLGFSVFSGIGGICVADVGVCVTICGTCLAAGGICLAVRSACFALVTFVLLWASRRRRFPGGGSVVLVAFVAISKVSTA